MGSGKDTVGIWLVEMGVSTNTIAFADAVYQVVNDVFGVARTDKTNRGRLFRQQVGSHMREISQVVDGHRDVWINLVERKISEDKVFAITDVRHLNEAEWILEKMEGALLFLVAPSTLRQERIQRRDHIEINPELWEKWSSHESERNVDRIFEKYKDHPSFILFEMDNDSFDENKEILRTLLLKNGLISELGD